MNLLCKWQFYSMIRGEAIMRLKYKFRIKVLAMAVYKINAIKYTF